MREIINISPSEIKPDKKDVLKSLGVIQYDNPSKRILDLFESSEEIFYELADPKGIISDVSLQEFARIYSGNGMNETDTPVKHIIKKADHLALFACTIGRRISQKIDELFRQKEFPMGSALDAVASSSAEKAVEIGEKTFLRYIIDVKKANRSSEVLLYSPGYCGWHISGQKELFKNLKPEDIGITLNSSFLMIPLKSVSGVLVGGMKSIHVFKDTYHFCSLCKDHSCVQRMNRLEKKETED